MEFSIKMIIKEYVLEIINVVHTSGGSRIIRKGCQPTIFANIFK